MRNEPKKPWGGARVNAGRPRESDEIVKARTIYLTDDAWEHLRDVSATYHISISRLIRDWSCGILTKKSLKEKTHNVK